MTATPPPGMYIDPENPRQQRFWNGTAWTDHVAPLEGMPADGAPMYAPPPRNATPPPMPPGLTPPPTMPPPDAAAAQPLLPPPSPAQYGAMPSAGAAIPTHLRPLSQAAVWSIVLSLLCPLAGLVFAFVGLAATAPSGNRRGRGAAVAGLALCTLSAIGGFIIGSQFAGSAG